MRSFKLFTLAGPPSAFLEGGPIPSPRPVPGAAPKEISIAGRLFPWDGAAPVFLSVPTASHLYLPCFTTAPQLRNALARAQVTFRSIKRIDNGTEFLDSLPRSLDGREVKVMLDPYWLPDGRVRWTEVKWN